MHGHYVTKISQYKLAEQDLRLRCQTEFSAQTTDQQKAFLMDKVYKVEQDTYDYIRTEEAHVFHHRAVSEQNAKLMNEEMYAKSQGLFLANQQNQQFQSESARVEQLLLQEKSDTMSAILQMDNARNNAISLQSEYVQALVQIYHWKDEHGTSQRLYQDEVHLHGETWELLQHQLSAPSQQPSFPPGLPDSFALRCSMRERSTAQTEESASPKRITPKDDETNLMSP
jgi:hypothetical protein